MPSVSPNSRQERIEAVAAEYVKNGFRRRQAVISAGITSNPNSAGVIANRLLSDVNTQLAIKRHMQDAKMSADEVLERLSKIARTEADIKGSDVVKANELLGKGHKLWVDKVESSNVNLDVSSNRVLLEKRIAKLASKTGQSPIDVERELQINLADRSDDEYSAELDASVHPEVWPSGNLLNSNNTEQIAEILGEQ